jgi:ectoine hydroxylase-related dioxygenase (phytanoyl-CoA dioxygenase family)
MKPSSPAHDRAVCAGWLAAEHCDVADLDRLVQTTTQVQDCPQASSILSNVPVYHCATLRAAQTAHCDYHLGFFTAAGAERFPAHVHQLSPYLTLQGAVAHVDMPLESGPTLYLPHSQKYETGYLVAGVPAFQAYFDQHHVQLPLKKGDGIFFNPALLHAAGHKRSADIRRMANLLQVSSAFGRCMETVDRVRMAQALYPRLLQAQANGHMPAADLDAAIAACAEGYAFPTNLDRDPPVGGLAPQSQQDLVRAALAQGHTSAQFNATLLAQAQTRLS